MTKELIYQTLTEVFRNVMDNNNIVLDEKSSAREIEEWDSITHIQLIIETEKKFKIKFGSDEIIYWMNVGEMVNSISLKLRS